jgi:hypothetical protein
VRLALGAGLLALVLLALLLLLLAVVAHPALGQLLAARGLQEREDVRANGGVAVGEADELGTEKGVGHGGLLNTLRD